MTSGRLTNCTDEVIEIAQNYPDEYDTKYDHAIPSVVGLCSVIKRSKSTVYEWAGKEGHVFTDIIKAINEKQEFVLASMGLKGLYNSTITKLLLTKHGYSDKVDTDHTSDGKQIKNEWNIHPIKAIDAD